MWKMGFRIAAFGFGLSLAACTSQVMTQKPLFSMNDAAMSQFRPGIWKLELPDCEKPAGPSGQDNCAGEVLISSSKISVAPPSDKSPTRHAEHEKRGLDYVLAGGGDPPLLQIRIPADANEPGAKDNAAYAYAAVSALNKSADGRIIKAEIWPVECGEPEPTKPGETASHSPPKSLMPGLRAGLPDGSVCLPEGADALRDAADATRRWSKGVIQAQWERDAATDDQG